MLFERPIEKQWHLTNGVQFFSFGKKKFPLVHCCFAKLKTTSPEFKSWTLIPDWIWSLDVLSLTIVWVSRRVVHSTCRWWDRACWCTPWSCSGLHSEAALGPERPRWPGWRRPHTGWRRTPCCPESPGRTCRVRAESGDKKLYRHRLTTHLLGYLVLDSHTK